jgi:hypothetical protein
MIEIIKRIDPNIGSTVKTKSEAAFQFIKYEYSLNHIEKSSVTFHFIKYIVDYIDEKLISS